MRTSGWGTRTLPWTTCQAPSSTRTEASLFLTSPFHLVTNLYPVIFFVICGLYTVYNPEQLPEFQSSQSKLIKTKEKIVGASDFNQTVRSLVKACAELVLGI